MEGQQKIEEVKALVAKAENGIKAIHAMDIAAAIKKKKYGSVMLQTFGEMEQIIGKKRKVEEADGEGKVTK